MTDLVRIHDRGHVRKIILNRPDKKNAVSLELAWGLIEAVRAASKEDNVWIIGLTGSEDAFCSGLDLTPPDGQESFIPMSDQERYLDELGWVSRFYLTLREECDTPIVGGINGVAVGAGLALAMASDIRIMADSARLIAGYPRIGGSPDGGLSITLSQAVGYEKAMRFLLENRTVTGEEAKQLGMVSQVVPDETFHQEFDDYLDSLTSLSPVTGRTTKRVMRAASGIDIEKQLHYELWNIGKSLGSLDGQEARRAFIEKRPPNFTGETYKSG